MKKKAPQIKRKRGKGGAFTGNCYVMLDGLRVDLGTEDHRVAIKNLRAAMKGKRDFTPDSQAAAVATVEKLAEMTGAPPPAPPAPPELAPAGAPPGPDLVTPILEIAQRPALHSVPPPPDQAPPANPTPPPAAPSPDPFQAANAAAAASSPEPSPAAARDGAPIAEAPLRFSDIPWMKGAFVTASKVAVGLQLHLQAWAVRLTLGRQVGPVGPIVPEPKTIEEVHELLAKSSIPWDERDPREPGRSEWEKFLRRICPDHIPIPDYVMAPLAVLIFTLPVQIAGSQPITPSAKPAEEASPPAASPAAAAA